MCQRVMSGDLCEKERNTGVFMCEVCFCVCACTVGLLQCACIRVCREGRGAGTVQILKKIKSALVYFEIYSSGGDGGGGFLFHTKTVISV